MATEEAELRTYVIEKATRSIPRGFVVEVHDRIRRAYDEEYAEVAHKPTTLTQQRIFKLNQDRCFRIDWELYEAAKAHGLSATEKPLPSNKWHHTYVTVGDFGLTQSYVQHVGDLPHPARYRDNLAEAARCPRLPLDDPKEIYEVKEFYALFAHNPVGRTFTEEHQRLGSLTFCVPSRDMKSWVTEISIPELISHYPTVKKPKKADRAPTWKRRRGSAVS